MTLLPEAAEAGKATLAKDFINGGVIREEVFTAIAIHSPMRASVHLISLPGCAVSIARAASPGSISMAAFWFRRKSRLVTQYSKICPDLYL
jgi:hypothetical protein